MTSAPDPDVHPDDQFDADPAAPADEQAHPTGRPPGSLEAEEAAGSGSDEASAAAVDADLDALVADVKRERDEYLELAQRTRADFENYRKRAARETTEAERRGKAVLARELVPAIDNLERALEAEEATEREALARGVELVLGELQTTLKRAGVETYDPLGERFDPVWHEALSTRADGGTEPGVVLETVERGYRLDGQVLRPARVVVSE